jgi:hypothetical protein
MVFVTLCREKEAAKVLPPVLRTRIEIQSKYRYPGRSCFYETFGYGLKRKEGSSFLYSFF